MGDKSTFGYLLRQYRYDANLTQSELAKLMAYARPTISNWETGRTIPPIETVVGISQVLNLRPEERDSLLTAAGYSSEEADQLPEGEVVPLAVLQEHLPRMREGEAGREAKDDAIKELRIQIQDIKDAVEDLSAHVVIQGVEAAGHERIELAEGLQNLKETISNLQATSQEITAPVSFPSRQDMEVKLIPTTSFERLEEYRSEESKWYSLSCLFVGAVLGIIINLVTGGEAMPTTWIIGVTFVIMALATGWTAYTYSKRSKAVRARIMGGTTQRKSI